MKSHPTFKIILTPILFIFMSFGIIQNTLSQDIKESIKRVESVGEAISNSSELYFTFVEGMSKFFKANIWSDQVTSIKLIRIHPVDDPSDWYYFASVRTKNTTAPFYVSYDIGDSNLGTLFVVEPNAFPKEFANHIAIEKQKYTNEEERKVYIENKAEEIFKTVLKDTMDAYFNDTLIHLANKIKEDRIDLLKKEYSAKIPPEKVMELANEANSGNYKWFLNSLDLVYVSDSKSILRIYLKQDENSALGRFIEYIKPHYKENLITYERMMNEKIDNPLRNYEADQLKFCNDATISIKKNIEKIASWIQDDPDYLNSKLSSATLKQKEFYNQYLTPNKKYTVTERFDQFCKIGNTTEERYQNMVEFYRNYQYYGSKWGF